MLELTAAESRILAAIPPLAAETILLSSAHGRFAAAPLLSPIDLPPFDNSGMDGYAVRAADLALAAAEKPIGLRLQGKVAAGEFFPSEVTEGTCVRIFTGSPLPRGADAVVMQEDTRLEAAQPDLIWFLEPAKPWEHVRLRGEDVKRGNRMVAAGERLTVGRISLLAAVGLKEVCVGRAPAVGLLATGSELLESGAPLAGGKIYESNRVALAALVVQAGAVPRILPLVPDTLSDTRTALAQAFDETDIVLTTGGVSVGEFDFVKAAFEQMGGKLDFWKVAIKPGKPFVFGQCRGKLLFGLPGNPVSALITFLMLVRPALLRLQGAAEVGLPTHPGVLAEPLINRGDRRHFMRVRVDEAGLVRSAGIQASHALSSLAQANGLVDVPPLTTLSAGDTVPVIRWE